MHTYTHTKPKRFHDSSTRSLTILNKSDTSDECKRAQIDEDVTNFSRGHLNIDKGATPNVTPTWNRIMSI